MYTRRSLCHLLLLIAILALLPVASAPVMATADGQWQPAAPVARRDHAVAASPTTAFLFGGYAASGTQRHLNDLWSWDGMLWHLLAQNGPSPRRGAVLAYDSKRDELVLFGGWNGSSELNDTWVWAGGNWTQRGPAQSPPARQYHAMTYHSARQRVVLFGGSSGDRNDTWEWDGSTWQQRLPAQSPPGRQQHALGYDSVRQRVVLFGGQRGTTPLADTWEWDGTNWAQWFPTTRPGARIGHVLVGTPAGVMLFGGDDGANLHNDLWVWDGSAWTARNATPLPAARFATGAAYITDRGQIILFGGSGLSSLLADTWEWNGTAWSRAAEPIAPAQRSQHAMADDTARAQIVLFGGSVSGQATGDTWVWEAATGWSQRVPAQAPSPRFGHAMAYDPLRDRVVLFGGFGDTSRADTWEWDGTNWTQRTPAQSPPPRWGHAMVYDAARGRIVLFGGATGTTGFYNDTWEWDGTTWTQRSAVSAPPARRNHALAYDSARGRVVLFGGYHLNGSIPTYFNDTWEWDGNQWVQPSPTSTPPGRSGHALVYQAARQRTLLIGGNGATTINDTIWAWDGMTWQATVEQPVPSPRSSLTATYQGAACRVVVFGGLGSSGMLADTWQLAVSPCTSAPIAQIDSIAPNPAYQSSDTIMLLGSGVAAPGSGLAITDYRWLLDGQIELGRRAAVTISASTLSLGTHTISLAVRDSGGLWSAPVLRSFQIIDYPRIAISPSTLNASLISGEMTQRNLIITNNGGSPLNVSLSVTTTVVLTSTDQAALLYMPKPIILPRLWNARMDSRLAAFVTTSSSQQESFLVFMDSLADLSPADQMSDWRERGRFVVRRLQEVAVSSQADTLAYLEQQKQAGGVSSYRAFYSINAIAVTGDAETLRHLLGQPRVIGIKISEVVSLPEETVSLSRAHGAQQATDGVRWNISRIGADRVWTELGVRGEGVVVGGLDTGVAYAHPLLRQNYRGYQPDGSYDHSYSWFDATGTFPDQPGDDGQHGHGTHTMGTMVAGGGIGVAPGARWIAAKGCTQRTCRDIDLLAAMEWLLAPYPTGTGWTAANPDMRPQVINNSWGSSGGRPIFQQMIAVWRAAGIFPAFSAGNAGPENGTLSSPADYADSFATGATGKDNILKSFSSRGPSLLTPNIKPDLAAPGNEIESCSVDGYTLQLNGTSMASPHTAGVVALMLSARPGLSVEQIEAILRSTAGDLGAGGPDSLYGYGLLDGYAAVRAAQTGLGWVRLPQTVALIQPGEQATPAVIFDARGLPAGTYAATLIIRSDDPDRAEMSVSLVCQVQDTQQQRRVLITHVTATGMIVRWRAPDGRLARLRYATNPAGPWLEQAGRPGALPGETLIPLHDLQASTIYYLQLIAADGRIEDNQGHFYQVTTSAPLPFGLTIQPSFLNYLPMIQR